MQVVAICENSQNIYRVFPEDIRKELKNYGFDGKVYSKSDIMCASENFKEVEYIFSTWGMPTFSEEEIRSYFPSLKCVFYAAGSVQKFARPFINSGVKVFSGWVANAVPVAEYTVAQIILANKGFFLSSKICDEQDYLKKRDEHNNYCGNYGVAIGIIGAGMIGKMVIEKLKDYNLKVKVFDPFLPDDIALELGVEKVSIEEIFSSCTVVSNHLADNDKTKGMIDYALLSRMPKYATFLNTGRGAQVVETDLVKFLKERPDVVAVLDVTEPEPPVDGSAMYRLVNCILTPHIAGSSGKEVCRMAEFMFGEFKNYIENKVCKYEVTMKMLETMA